MAASSRILFNHNLKRAVCTTTGNFAKYRAREGRIMKKLLGGDSGKSKWYKSKEHPPSPITPEKLTSNHVTRRMTVLNKLFMAHITDLMATGEVSSQLLGRSIEVTHVKVTPDFNFVLVYWYSTMCDRHDETEKVLNNCAYSLRHELTQLRVIGRIPTIKFVKNKQMTDLDELDKRLRIADYGDYDYEPLPPTPVVKDELILNIKFPPKLKEEILQAEDAEKNLEEDNETEFDVILPPMRHDVLGLDHHAVMSRVTHALSKCRGKGGEGLDSIVTFQGTAENSTFNPLSFQSAEDSTAFMDFLAKRQHDEKSKLRREKRAAILAYNASLNESESFDDEVEHTAEAEDIDAFEDISLETLK